MIRRIPLLLLGLAALGSSRAQEPSNSMDVVDELEGQELSRLPKSRRMQGAQLVDDTALHVNFLTACIMPFRTYVPSAENQFRVPYGNVRITFDGGSERFNQITRGAYPGYSAVHEFTFQYDLQGLPSDCESCRIQVTNGETCDEPGIRFWNRNVEGAVNPWRPEWGAVYTSNRNGQTRGFFSMFDGFAFDDHKSRTVVVFAEDNKTRLGCGVINRREYGECNYVPNGSESEIPTEAPIIVGPTGTTTPSPITRAPSITAPGTPLPTVPIVPDRIPTSTPSQTPTIVASTVPSFTAASATPSAAPTTAIPSVAPTAIPSVAPTAVPSVAPTAVPSIAPTTALPSIAAATPIPSAGPTTFPPTPMLTLKPSSQPPRPPTLAPSVHGEPDQGKGYEPPPPPGKGVDDSDYARSYSMGKGKGSSSSSKKSGKKGKRRIVRK